MTKVKKRQNSELKVQFKEPPKSANKKRKNGAKKRSKMVKKIPKDFKISSINSQTKIHKTKKPEKNSNQKKQKIHLYVEPNVPGTAPFIVGYPTAPPKDKVLDATLPKKEPADPFAELREPMRELQDLVDRITAQHRQRTNPRYRLLNIEEKRELSYEIGKLCQIEQLDYLADLVGPEFGECYEGDLSISLDILPVYLAEQILDYVKSQVEPEASQVMDVEPTENVIITEMPEQSEEILRTLEDTKIEEVQETVNSTTETTTRDSSTDNMEVEPQDTVEQILEDETYANAPEQEPMILEEMDQIYNSTASIYNDPENHMEESKTETNDRAWTDDIEQRDVDENVPDHVAGSSTSEVIDVSDTYSCVTIVPPPENYQPNY